jgi:iron(III) transport system permease protein
MDGDSYSTVKLRGCYKRNYWRTFLNSIQLGVIVAGIATAIGYVFAFAITRTEMPGKGFVRAIATLPSYRRPSYSLSIYYVWRQGFITSSFWGYWMRTYRPDQSGVVQRFRIFRSLT